MKELSGIPILCGGESIWPK